MTLLVYAVHDSKAGAFLQPLFFVNRAVALRAFIQACKDENSDFHRYAEDYALYELGEWDPRSGKYSDFETHECLGLASSFLNVEVRS